MHNIYYLGLSGERSLPFGLLVFREVLGFILGKIRIEPSVRRVSICCCECQLMLKLKQ